MKSLAILLAILSTTAVAHSAQETVVEQGTTTYTLVSESPRIVQTTMLNLAGGNVHISTPTLAVINEEFGIFISDDDLRSAGLDIRDGRNEYDFTGSDLLPPPLIGFCSLLGKVVQKAVIQFRTLPFGPVIPLNENGEAIGGPQRSNYEVVSLTCR